jgi:membrane protein DedA with SNARE-associated domain
VGEPLDGLGSWVIGIGHARGYSGVAALLVVEALFPPIPSELVLPLAGYLAGRGELPCYGVVLAATLGSVTGALLLDALRRRLGDRRVRALVRRVPLLEEPDLDRAEPWFQRHGEVAVLVGRLMPAVRSAISLPAGVARVPLGRFLGYTVVGSALWNAAWVAAGWWLGTHGASAQHYARPLGYAGLIGFGIGTGCWVGRRLTMRLGEKHKN